MSTEDVPDRPFGDAESQTLEFKSSADARGVAEAVCGMLNRDGGVVVIGVADDGCVIGLDRVEESRTTMEEVLREAVTPPAAWSVRVAEQSDKSLLCIDVPRGSQPPYVVRGKVIVRKGSSSSAADASEINRLIQLRLQVDQHWERQPAVGIGVESLDLDEVERVIAEAKDAGRLGFSVGGARDFLQKLRLLVDGIPIQAAAVAFAAEVLPWYPQCAVRLARFRGVTKDEFVDERKVSGHAFDLLRAASDFLSKHLPISGSFVDGQLERQDKPLYPFMALREALVNAICHRDYSIAGGAVSVAIFDDRLEVASTGRLPPGLSADNLKHDHYSQPRNPLLADIFYRCRLIELWGRGTQRMVRECVQAGCPEPQYEERAGEFVVRFLSPNYSVSVPDGLDLTPRQARVLALFRASPSHSLREIRDGVDPGVSESTIRNDLNHLRELGLIKAVGVGRGAYWRVTSEGSP